MSAPARTSGPRGPPLELYGPHWTTKVPQSNWGYIVGLLNPNHKPGNPSSRLAFRLNCFDLDKLFDVVKPAGAIAPDMVIKCRTGTDLGDIEFPCHSSILRTKAALGTGTQMVEIESDRKTLQTMLLYVYTSEKRVLWDALRGFLPDEVDEYPTTEDYAKSEAGAWWEARRRGEDRELPSAIVHDMAEYLENALRLSKCAASLNMLDTECWECIAWAWIPAAEVGRKALEAILQGVEMEEREEIMGRDDEMEG